MFNAANVLNQKAVYYFNNLSGRLPVADECRVYYFTGCSISWHHGCVTPLCFCFSWQQFHAKPQSDIKKGAKQ